MQIDGVWHTSVVVFGKEFFFGGGILSEEPGVCVYVCVCMHVCVCGCLHICMDVCMYVHMIFAIMCKFVDPVQFLLVIRFYQRIFTQQLRLDTTQITILKPQVCAVKVLIFFFLLLGISLEQGRLPTAHLWTEYH